MFGTFGQNSPSYEGTPGAQTARPSCGLFGVLGNLFGGDATVVYKTPPPDPAPDPTDNPKPDPTKRPCIIIVVFVSPAKAPAILEHLDDQLG
jgi:hypothetical protein